MRTGGAGFERVEVPEIGLEAVIAVDRLRFGCAAGGVRIRAYGSRAAVEAEARSLALAMTRKAALADLPCGGAKVVVRALEGMDRPRALALLGERIEARAGEVFVGPDYGFLESDRLAMAGTTRYVDDPERLGDLDRSTALGVREAIAAALERETLAGARVGVLGIGKVGRALVSALRTEGATVLAHDPDASAAAAGAALGAHLLDEAALVESHLDALAPCALGRWLDEGVARRLGARVVAGSANDVLAGDAAAAVLEARGIPVVPDLIASAGAFIHWAAVILEGETPAASAARVRSIGPRTRRLLARARAERRPPHVVAIEEATLLAARWRE